MVAGGLKHGVPLCQFVPQFDIVVRTQLSLARHLHDIFTDQPVSSKGENHDADSFAFRRSPRAASSIAAQARFAGTDFDHPRRRCRARVRLPCRVRLRNLLYQARHQRFPDHRTLAIPGALCGSNANSNRENAMSDDKWWAAQRKAAEFWRKVKENQTSFHRRNSLNRDNGATPIARPRASVARLLSLTGHC
jgi:hypothetical protein